MTSNAHDWWGPVEGELHLFEAWIRVLPGGGEGERIRTGERAACGWVPPVGVMECPDELDEDRQCRRCLDVEP